MFHLSEGRTALVGAIERVVREAMRQGVDTEGLPPMSRDVIRERFAGVDAEQILNCVAAELMGRPTPLVSTECLMCTDGGPPCFAPECASECRRAKAAGLSSAADRRSPPHV